MNLEMDDIPADYDPQPVPYGTPDSATCGSCGLSFPDLYPSARCPFEQFHEMDDANEPEPDDASWDLMLFDANRIREIWEDRDIPSAYRNRKISEYIRMIVWPA